MDLFRALAIARIGLGLATLITTWEMYGTLSRVVDTTIALPYFAALPSPTTTGVWVVTALCALAGSAMTVGWYARSAAVAVTALSAWIFVWDQQTYSSHRVLALLLIAMLCFTACDRVWALRPQPDGRTATWVPLLMMSQLSVCYLFAGLSKVNPVFPAGRQFDYWLWLPLPSQLDMALAWGTILAEVFMAGALWFRPTRGLAVVLGIILHVSIVVTMKSDNLVLAAFTLICVSVYPLFFVRRVGGAVRGSSGQECLGYLPRRSERTPG